MSRIRLVAPAVALVLIASAASLAYVQAQPEAGAARAAAVGAGQPYREPVVLSSSNGVLEVTLTAKQGQATFDTAAGPVSNALLFSYSLERGAASNGQSTGSNLYPGPTLQVNPGETLIVHMANSLAALTIKDYSDPMFTPKGKAVPLYPKQLTASPFNNHTHGLHVSPAGNSDNVLLNIPPDMANTYTYAIPTDHPQGLYWYHSHRHTLTDAQTYRGLMGMLSIGRPDGGIPAVTQAKLPVRSMALQYNYVFNRAGGQTVLNNAYWPANLSTLKKASAKALADGTYEPKLTPINFTDSKVGTQYFTAWYDGPLSVDNNRGVFQYMPSNLQSFTSADGKVVIPANASLPESQRDVQYTVNGQFQPVIATPPGQTEIWVLGNFSDAAYMRVAVTKTTTGEAIPLTIVGQDGNPYTTVQAPAIGTDNTLLIPPATRYAIAVTMPAVGGLKLEMPPVASGSSATTSNPGILYTNNGTRNSPAVTGRITVNPANVSFMDGFFDYPTQTLLTVQPASGTGTTVPFAPGQPLGAYTSFDDLSGVKPDVTRTLVINGGFTNQWTNANDPNTFAYQFDGNQFPNIPLLQPRLNTSEQWNFVNTNNDQHPIHIHVNDYQVTDYVDPVAKVHLTNLPFGQDNQNTPAPLFDAKGNVAAPGRMSLRTEFKQFIGAYVVHCHRLNHEDNGLMAIINVIPEVTAYAVAVPGSGSTPTRVTIYNQATRRPIATVAPAGAGSGPVDVAMGDVNGDMILDLIVGSGPGAEPRVRALSGAADASGARFATVLIDTLVFPSSFRGGVRVASANIDGTQGGDSIVVGSGVGMPATVKVLASGLRAGKAADFAEWRPYGAFSGGVNVATGLVDASGRASIVTAPGAGIAPLVKTYVFDLFTAAPSAAGHGHAASAAPAGAPMQTASFLAFESTYRGGVSVATGWVAAKDGGFSRIIAGRQSGSSQVAVFSSGSALDGSPKMYLMSPSDMSMDVAFTRSALFTAFPGSTRGVDVATSANPTSADLLVSGGSGTRGEVATFTLGRANTKAKAWTATRVHVAQSAGAISGLGGQ
ncbi:MAG: multicopper oxidase domain-containing protein [Candidatus Nanopelagicales bacterium]|nr:multicopper oxidase domain-containing protein [Candidatus Nanopelagicales bacterium]